MIRNRELGRAVAAVMLIIGLAIANVWLGVLPVRMFTFTSLAGAIAPAMLIVYETRRRRGAE
jgi:hypothetical protein